MKHLTTACEIYAIDRNPKLTDDIARITCSRCRKLAADALPFQS